MTNHDPPYALGAAVRVKQTGETGTVRGLFCFTGMMPRAYLDYQNAYGRAVSGWFDTDLIEAVGKPATQPFTRQSFPKKDTL